MPGGAVPTPYEPTPEHYQVMTPEKKESLAEQRKVADEKRDSAGLAKFKIEILFNKGFSVRKPSAGIVSFWENANKLHGGGDSIIHFCPGKKLKKNECEHYIPDPSHGYGFLVCPKCHEVWDGEQVDGQIAARLSPQGWAELIHRYYRRLDMRCDVVIKYHSEDIRNAARATNAGDALAKVRSSAKRIRRIYTMSAIIRDTSAGADLQKRFLAFVTA